jgi:hypothetical protein
VGKSVWTKGARYLKHARNIRKFDETFDAKVFGETAQQILIDAHTALMNRDLEAMSRFVTENALPVSFEIRLLTLFYFVNFSSKYILFGGIKENV